MFETTYVVDVLVDGEQVADSGIVTREDSAHATFETHSHILATSVDYRDDQERTVRLICNGDVIREKTIRNGEILDELNRC